MATSSQTKIGSTAAKRTFQLHQDVRHASLARAVSDQSVEKQWTFALKSSEEITYAAQT